MEINGVLLLEWDPTAPGGGEWTTVAWAPSLELAIVVAEAFVQNDHPLAQIWHRGELVREHSTIGAD